MATEQEQEPLMADASTSYGAADGTSPTRRRSPNSTSSCTSTGSGPQDASVQSVEAPAGQKSTKIHVTVLICQLLCIAFMAWAGALYLDNHSHRWGQCLMTAYYMPGGILKYSELTIYCDVVAHISIMGCYLIVSMISVNWFAGIRSSLKCIKIEMVLSTTAFMVTLVGCSSLIWNLWKWCDNLSTSVKCQKGDQSCPVETDMSCVQVAKEFDHKKYSKYDKMMDNYESMTNQTGLLLMACILWGALTILMTVLMVRGIREGGTAGLYRLSSTKYTRPIQRNPEHVFSHNSLTSDRDRHQTQ